MKLKSVEYKSTIIKSSNTIKDALNNLVNSSKRICLVVNKKNNFIGTITDGDIRRALLKNFKLSSPITKIINKKPLRSSISDNLNSIKAKMIKGDIWQTPIINKKKIIGLLILTDEHQNKIYNTIFYIPAGGFGKRMGALTHEIPKPMLIIKGKPIIQHIIENAKLAGFKDFVISLHYKSSIIKKFAKDKNFFGVNIKFINEKKPLGTCGSLAKTLKLSYKEVVVHNGDIIGDINYQDLLNFHYNMRNKITVVKSSLEYLNPFGVIKINKKNLLTELKEKPIYKFNILSGIYILNKSVLRTIKQNTFTSMTDFLSKNLRKKISVYHLKKQWNDIGSPKDITTVNDILKKL